MNKNGAWSTIWFSKGFSVVKKNYNIVNDIFDPTKNESFGRGAAGRTKVWLLVIKSIFKLLSVPLKIQMMFPVETKENSQMKQFQSEKTFELILYIFYLTVDRRRTAVFVYFFVDVSAI